MPTAHTSRKAQPGYYRCDLWTLLAELAAWPHVRWAVDTDFEEVVGYAHADGRAVLFVRVIARHTLAPLRVQRIDSSWLPRDAEAARQRAREDRDRAVAIDLALNGGAEELVAERVDKAVAARDEQVMRATIHAVADMIAQLDDAPAGEIASRVRVMTTNTGRHLADLRRRHT